MCVYRRFKDIGGRKHHSKRLISISEYLQDGFRVDFHKSLLTVFWGEYSGVTFQKIDEVVSKHVNLPTLML